VPLPETYTHAVLFIRQCLSKGRSKVLGTAFFIGIRSPQGGHHVYVVTAAHIVERVSASFVQVRLTNGEFHDLEITDWVPHGKHDVAVAPISLPDNHAVYATELDQFIDEPDALGPRWGEVELGDVVYFIGLLGKVQAMVDRNIPIVRAGFLGALWQENVPVKRSEVDETKYITAHLIDCRSFGGFSGSPCYLQKSRAAVVNEDGRPGILTEYRTLFFGLIGGHFDDWAKTKERQVIPEDEDTADEDAVYATSDDIKAPVSTGVGYVIPAEYVRETLMREELKEMRRKDEEAAAEAVRRETEENAATLDSAESESEFERFEDLAKKLVNTPKEKDA
jgi:hypothetical protein